MRPGSIAAGLVLMAGAAAAQDSVPRIDETYWHNIDSYCSFIRADHTLDYNDPGSWRWLLFSNFPTGTTDPLEAPFMRIDGQLKQLAQTGIQAVDGGEVRTYTSHDAEPYDIEMSLHKGEKGYESTAFSGVIKVTRNGASSEVAFKGDCGV